MNKVTAIIPTRYESPYIAGIIDTLGRDSRVEDILILDNGINGLQRANLSRFRRVTILPCHGKTIYQMWNYGMDVASNLNGRYSYTAVLNDDIVLYDNTISYLADNLDLNVDLVAISPDYDRRIHDGATSFYLQYVTSTFGHGGLGCFAFLIKNYPKYRIDEQFGWWYGDDDLVKKINASGKKMAKLMGLPVEHNQGWSFNQRSSELHEQILKDNTYFNSKYGESRGTR